ncbi:MAG: glycosyltransferase 87 family protein, partial [Fibrobacterota bacterium]
MNNTVFCFRFRKHFILGYLALSCLVNTVPFLTHQLPDDLRNVYVGATILSNGGNPYDDITLKRTWIEITKEQGITGPGSSTPPGLPTPLLYSPNALGFYIPFSWISWNVLAPMAQLMSLLCIFIASYFFVNAERKDHLPVTLMLLVLLALNGTGWVIGNANPAAFSLLFIAIFYYHFKKGKVLLSGVWLGLAAVKITLAFPLFAFLVARREYKACVIG